ncbi:MAG: hypothetical protein LBK02_01375 [Treponema sp.]|jgi:hypothetical protein|nr:hypothetical protein [Treponema sp.]
MKYLCVLAGLLLSGCRLVDSVYSLELPDLPASWEDLLGPPQWRVEWISPGGKKESLTTVKGLEISMPHTWASPVSAGPFWPDAGIRPGLFYPAGAIFPFDLSGNTLALSWRGGVDAVLYWELAAACAAQAADTDEASIRSALLRQPRNFDWPRFRELLDDPSIPEEVRLDPWTVDWKTTAARIVLSGFDKRRIVPEAWEETPIPVPAGSWIGLSPFAPPLVFDGDETPVFPIGSKTGSWFSPAGVLRCNTETWIFISKQ